MVHRDPPAATAARQDAGTGSQWLYLSGRLPLHIRVRNSRVLESINGVALDAASPGKTIPELAFGEHRSVSGTTGCKRFSGLVVLPLESGDVFC